MRGDRSWIDLGQFWTLALPPSSRRPMLQDLPGDVLLVVLHMLAVQDPFALVAATCLCKSFRRAAAENPGLWKEAFYGAANGRGEVPLEDHCAKQRAKLEKEIQFLGGYKRLVEARCWTRLKCEQSQDGHLSISGPLTGCGFADCNSLKTTKLLIIIRLKGSIFLWCGHKASLGLHELFPEKQGLAYQTTLRTMTAPNLVPKYREKLEGLAHVAKNSEIEGRWPPGALTLESYALACTCSAKPWDRNAMISQSLSFAPLFGLDCEVSITEAPFYPVFHRLSEEQRQQEGARASAGASKDSGPQPAESASSDASSPNVNLQNKESCSLRKIKSILCYLLKCLCQLGCLTAAD